MQSAAIAAVDVRRLRTPDLIQGALGVVLAAAVCLPWYETAPRNPFSNIDGQRGDLSAWQVHPVLRWVLLAAVAANLLGTWHTVRARRTELPRGYQTLIVATALTGVVLYTGLVHPPGTPSDTVALQYGWFLALAALLGAVVCGLARVPAAKRKPPGAVR